MRGAESRAIRGQGQEGGPPRVYPRSVSRETRTASLEQHWTLQLWRPKALEHCDEEADGSRRIRWLGGACESRKLEEHREWKQRGETAERRSNTIGGPTAGLYPRRLFDHVRERRRRFLDSKVATRTASPRLPWLFE